MNVFVTGGSGFVGQNIIPVLIENGYTVYALARSESSANKVSRIGAIPIFDDLTDLGSNTLKALASCEFVLHSAAHMDFTYDPTPFYAINVMATRNLLEMAKQQRVKHFVYISAAPVVPGSPIINLTEDQAKEGLPKALYPKTKAIAEKAVLAANDTQMRTLSLRPPAIWGPDNHHYKEIFSRVKKGQWRWIGGGTHILSTIHVKNLANAVLAAFNSSQGGKAYFVTDGDQRPIKKTFSSILQAYGLEAGDKSLPRPVAVIASHIIGRIWKTFQINGRPPVAPIMIRLMGTEFSVSDAKARLELGYKNALSFEEGITNLSKQDHDQIFSFRNND
ncbi:MAG: NAD-dependent epimerase/dehydratase family protein [Bacteroidota bacterium]